MNDDDLMQRAHFDLMYRLDEAAVIHRGEHLGDILRAAHSEIAWLWEANRQLRAALLFDLVDGQNQVAVQ